MAAMPWYWPYWHLDLQPGDEVLVPGFTFFATAGSVSRIGAVPVFVDVCDDDYNIDLKKLKTKITSRTRAIIPVHLFGMPLQMDQLLAFAAEHRLAIVEDVAQSLGSTCQGQQAGSLGEIGCFSFFPTKNLGCFGDGGMVTTNRDDLAERLLMLRVHGTRRKYHHELLGFNSRLDTLQAAILRVKLPYLTNWLKARQRIAATYREGLQDLPGIQLPAAAAGHTYNQFTVRVERRAELQQFLAGEGIGSSIYYPLGLHLQPVFAGLNYQRGDLPVTEALTERVLSLPIFPELNTVEQAYVITKVREFLGVGPQ